MGIAHVLGHLAVLIPAGTMKVLVYVLLGVSASAWGSPQSSTAATPAAAAPQPPAAPPAAPSADDEPADEDTKRDKRQWYFGDFYPDTFNAPIPVGEPIPVPVPVQDYPSDNGQGFNPQYRTRNPGFFNGAQFGDDEGVPFSELLNYQQQQLQQQQAQFQQQQLQQQQQAQFQQQQQQFPDGSEIDTGVAASTTPEFRSRRPFRGHISPYYNYQRPFGYGYNAYRNPYLY
nr:protein couch potato-like isoform X1 [Procambarus clarkii]